MHKFVSVWRVSVLNMKPVHATALAILKCCAPKSCMEVFVVQKLCYYIRFRCFFYPCNCKLPPLTYAPLTLSSVPVERYCLSLPTGTYSDVSTGTTALGRLWEMAFAVNFVTRHALKSCTNSFICFPFSHFFHYARHLTGFTPRFLAVTSAVY